MPALKRSLLAAITLFSSPIFAQDFDTSLLPGLWAESVDTQPACAEENLHFRFELSPDGKILKFKLDRMWEIATGKSVDQYSAKVLNTSGKSMTIEYIDLDGLPEDYPKTWELAFVAPGVYRWHAADWPEGRVNPVVGIHCAE